MVQRVSMVAFEGIKGAAGDVQVQVALPAFKVVGLPDKAVSEAPLVGGGLHARPGEVSLAHHGVLFLDKSRR